MNVPDTHPAVADRHTALALGLFILTVYLTTSSLSFHSIDEFAVFGVARSLAGHGHFDADVLYWVRAALGRGSVVAGGLDAHTYAVKDVAPSLLITPLVWTAYRLPISPIRAALLFSPLVTAITASGLYLTIRSWGCVRRTALLGALVFALGSLAWPYAETLFTQPLAALGLLIALQGSISARKCRRWPDALLSGLGLGLAGLSAVPAWITLPIYILFWVPWQSLRDRRAWQQALPLGLAFAAGAGLLAGGQGVYNLARFGSLLETGYQQNGTADFRLTTLAIGLFGQLVSAPRGLIWVVPFVLLIPAGLWLGLRSPNRARSLLAAAQAALILLFYSSYAIWWGGLGWGPRFLVAIMPALTLLAVPLLDHFLAGSLAKSWRAVVAAVLVVSFGTQLLASLFDLYPSDAPLADALNESPPPAFPAVLVDARALPWPRQFAAIRAGAWDTLPLQVAPFDWPLLGIQVSSLLFGGLLFARLIQRPRSRLSMGSAAQIALPAVLALAMLLRYPTGPNEVPHLDALAALVSRTARPGDGLVVLLPSSIFGWIETYDSRAPDIGVSLEDSLSSDTTTMLAHAATRHPRLWLVAEGTAGGNPANGVEHWLSMNAFVGSEQWLEGYRVVPYILAEDEPLRAVSQAFSGGISLDRVSVSRAPGWLNVLLIWSAHSLPESSYTVFVHLLDSSGVLVAQHDGIPAAGYAPMPGWQPGSQVEDRRSLMLPPDLPPGTYSLYVGLYDPLSGARLPLANSSGDALLLETLTLGN